MLKNLFLLFILLSSILPPCSAEETIMEVIPLNNRPASEIQSLITPLLENSEQVINNGSRLIIKASPERQLEFKKLIRQLDTRLNNLTITVIQSRTKTAKELNASRNFNNPDYNSADISDNYYNHFARTEGLKNTDSKQQITTLDGKPAIIKTGKTYPIHDIGLFQYGYPAISSNTQFIEVSTGFTVLPRLTGDRVIIEVKPWSDRVNNSGKIENQSAQTSVQVNLGEWIEIGGIDKNSEMQSSRVTFHNYSTKNNNVHILIKVEKL